MLLLIRTFLTLEGIAARVDPEFNIYEMAMPWAVRRSLSPASADGIATMRDTLLTPDNRVQWERLIELTQDASMADAETAGADTAAGAPALPDVHTMPDAAAAEDQMGKRQANEAAKAQAMNDAVGSLLGSASGAPLRRALLDLDSTDLAMRLVSKEARQLRHSAALAVCGALMSTFTSGEAEARAQAVVAAEARPVSDTAVILRQRQERWKRKVGMLLVANHIQRQLARGRCGLAALGSLAYLAVRILVGGLTQAAKQVTRRAIQSFGGGSAGGGDAPSGGVATAC